MERRSSSAPASIILKPRSQCFPDALLVGLRCKASAGWSKSLTHVRAVDNSEFIHEHKGSTGQRAQVVFARLRPGGPPPSRWSTGLDGVDHRRGGSRPHVQLAVAHDSGAGAAPFDPASLRSNVCPQSAHEQKRARRQREVGWFRSNIVALNERRLPRPKGNADRE